MERQTDKSPLCRRVLHMLTGTSDERRVRRADVEQDKSFPGEHLFLLHCTIPLIAGPNNLPFETAAAE